MSSVYDTVVAAIKTALDAVYVKKNSTAGLLKNDGTVDSTSYQQQLVSGTSIKTINNESVLGSGNISISGGGGGGTYIDDYYFDSTNKQLVIEYENGVTPADIVTSWSSTTSDEKVPSEKLTKTSLDDKVSKSNTSGLLKNDGSVMTSGTGSSNWAAGNHTHSGYASSSHNHNYTDVNNVSTVTITVTYSNNTSENITLLRYTGS